jgi:hypothetical protein
MEAKLHQQTTQKGDTTGRFINFSVGKDYQQGIGGFEESIKGTTSIG